MFFHCTSILKASLRHFLLLQKKKANKDNAYSNSFSCPKISILYTP